MESHGMLRRSSTKSLVENSSEELRPETNHHLAGRCARDLHHRAKDTSHERSTCESTSTRDL